MINALRISQRELRGGVRGFRVFIACLALGVAVIAGIGSVASSLIAGLEEDGAILLGGDIALRTTHRDISQEQRNWLRENGRVSRVVYFRSMARGTKNSKRALVELKLVDKTYPLYGALKVNGGNKPDSLFSKVNGIWGIVCDSALLVRLGIKVGDTISIGESRYEIRGTIRQEPDRISGRAGLQIGPRLIGSADSIKDTTLVQRGSLVWYFYRVRIETNKSLSAWRNKLNKAFPDAQWILQDRRNASPTIKQFIDRTTLFMTLVGLTTLLIGGIGISNAVRNFLFGKIRTIATLKCIGASVGIVFSAYLIQVMVMAVIGIIIGLVLGAFIPLAVANIFDELLPIVARFNIYWEPLALASGFGILTALGFCIWPIARACDLPASALFRHTGSGIKGMPRWPFVLITFVLLVILIFIAIESANSKPIAMWFISGAAAAIILFAGAGVLIKQSAKLWAKTGSFALRLALANMHRPGSQTGNIILSLGLGLTVLVALALIEKNLSNQINEEMPKTAPEYFFIDIQNTQIEKFQNTIQGIRGVREMRTTPMLRGRITRVNGKPAKGLDYPENSRWLLRGDRGVTWATSMPKGEKLIAGKWWSADYNGPPLVSLAANAAEALSLNPGDTITTNILGRNITATIANLRDVQWRSLRMNFIFIYSPGLLENAPQTHLATVHTDPSRESVIEEIVGSKFPNVTAIRVRDVLETVNEFISNLGLAIRLTAGVAIVAGTLVLAGAIMSGHRRRVYDSIVLKVLGATRKRVIGTLLLEYVLLGMTTAVIASVFGSIAAWGVTTHVMQLKFSFDLGTVTTTSVIAVLLSVFFGLYGIWRALGQKPAPVLRND